MKSIWLTLVLGVLATGAAQAEPPTYVIVNKTGPRFVVVDKTTRAACPAPVASKPDLVTTDGRTIRWTGAAYVFVGSAPVSGCANGQCPLPRR